MNFLNALHQLLGAHPQAPQPGQPHPQHVQFVPGQAQQHPQVPQQQSGGVYEDGSGVSLGHINPYQAGHGVPLQLRGGQEDSQMVMGPQGLVPMNADVAHFQGNQYAQGGQFNPGYTPLQNSGFGPGGNPQIRAFNRPTNSNMVNPQLRDRGYFWNN